MTESTSPADNPAPTTVATGMTFTECPRWHGGRWYFVDFYSHRVLSMEADGADLRTELTVPAQPSGLGWLPDGRLLVVSMKDRRILRREADGTVVEHADLSDLAAYPLNDMVVDEVGRAYVGNFGFDLMAGEDAAPTPLILVDTDGSARHISEPLYFPNGSVITPDGKTLIVDETFGNRVSAFDILEDGSLGPRRDWRSSARCRRTGTSRRSRRSRSSPQMAAVWTPTATSGWRTPWVALPCSSPKVARSSGA